MNNFWKNKRGTAMAAMAVLCLAAGTAGTMGYFTDEEKVTNVFTVGDLEVDLQEPEWTPEDGDGEDMCPGYSVYKNPTVKNTADQRRGGNSCYVRMKVEILDSKGAPVTDKKALELIKATIRYDKTYTGSFSSTGKAMQITQNRVPGYFLSELKDIPMVNPVFKLDTVRSAENVLFYNYQGNDGTGVLKAGEEAVLFTNIVIPAEWAQEEMQCMGDFQLVVTAQAIQVSGFASMTDAFLALDTEITKGGSNG